MITNTKITTPSATTKCQFFQKKTNIVIQQKKKETKQKLKNEEGAP
jgi:hypothetical protein